MKVTVQQVARRANVSVGTVSNVLNRPEIVAAPTRERVLRVIDELGFVRNESARQLRTGAGRIIGLVTHRIGDDECGVGVDDLRGGELAMGHLLALGHERIGYITSASHVWPTDERREGMLSAARKDGKSDVLHDISVEHLNVAHGRDAGERILGVRPRPTAVICANDLVALGVAGHDPPRRARARRHGHRRLRRHRVRVRRRHPAHVGPPPRRRSARSTTWRA